MSKRMLTLLVLSILVASALVGCSQGPSSTPSTLTILSITEGNVFVMKAGTDDWIEAEVGMSLEVGDSIKTGDDSSAKITFFDGSTIELQPGTEIEIASLDISQDTGSTTITLQQTIGTTISRVTKLLDPASSYEIETPTGVAAVRGSSMTVTVAYVTPQIIGTLITNLEGYIWAIAQGVELQIPEGRQCIIIFGEPPELILLNDPPVAVNDSAIANEDHAVTVAAPGVLNNDSDPDVGDTLTVTSVDTSGTVGNVTAWNADGSFTYDPDGQFEYLQAPGSTTDSFTYTVFDDLGSNDTATVTITIKGLNDPPVAVKDSAITNEDTPITIAAPGVLKNDSDPDVGDTLTVTSVDTSGTVGAVTTWNANGSFTYDPDGQFEYLQAGNSTTDSFTYRISDGHGGTDTAAVTITINGVNDPGVNHPPVAVDDAAITDEDNHVTVSAPGVLNNDSDLDVGDTLTITAVDTSGTIGTVTAWYADGSFAYNPNGQFEYLQAGYAIADSFTYTVSDGNGGTDTATVTITINGVNDPPAAVSDSGTTPEDTPITIDVLDNDSDIDGGTLTIDSVTNGTNGSVTNHGSDVTYTPDVGFNGTDSFTYTISDGNGGTDTATVTVTVIDDETLARIGITIDTGPTASVYIWNNTTSGWAIDEITKEPVDGSNHETNAKIYVAGGDSYCVWVGGDVTYDVKTYPSGWSKYPLDGGGEQACGTAVAGSNYPVHFTETPPS